MSFPRPRVPTLRLVALTIAASAAAMIGLGSAAAHAAPTTATTPTSAPTTSATTPTSTPTTSSPTTSSSTTGTTATTATTSTTTSTTTPGTSATTTPSGPSATLAPGPQCAGQSDVLTPVLCIPTSSGEDQPAPVGTDGYLEFAAQVVNNGPAVVAGTVVITLPPGLRVETDEGEESVTRYEKWWTKDFDYDGTDLDCTSSSDGSVVTCATGAIAAGANFLVAIDLDGQDDTVAGTSADFTVALQSAPVAGVFPTTSVRATVDYVGTAHLQVHLTPLKASVVLGQSLTVTATVHNVGPNSAVEAAGIGFALPDDDGDVYPFVITNSQPFPGGFATASSFALRSSAKRTASATSAASAPSPIGFWPIGTIAPGQTATVTIVVKAVKLGKVELNFDATSADASCDDGDDPTCENEATAALTAVRAPTTAATTTAATTAAVSVSVTTVTVSASSGSSAAALANTGFQPAPWVGSGAAAVLLGGGLILLGAPRRRARGRHR